MNYSVRDRRGEEIGLPSHEDPTCYPLELAHLISSELNERFSNIGEFIVNASFRGFTPDRAIPPLNHIIVLYPKVMLDTTYGIVAGVIQDVNDRLKG